MKTFEINDKVVLLDQSLEKYNLDEENSTRGIVVAQSPKEGKILVQWTTNYYKKGKIEEVDSISLCSEVEAEEKLTKLEAEFNVWSDQAKEKVAAAAQLLREAGEITQSHGHALVEVYDLTGPLIRAMDDCGWNTSSFNC
jgi:hypothetical protein